MAGRGTEIMILPKFARLSARTLLYSRLGLRLPNISSKQSTERADVNENAGRPEERTELEPVNLWKRMWWFIYTVGDQSICPSAICSDAICPTTLGYLMIWPHYKSHLV